MAQFRTKARAIELLGKGQIADLPTAISELWKNGYDAYASALSCNLYLEGYNDVTSPVFTLSDNGFGMDREDILNKWIVLGTDSKAHGTTFHTKEQRFGLAPRTPMGEKGIGRLSVSFLGSPMLMMTKKEGKKVQLLFFDWRILENFNMFVDDVIIPLRDCNSLSELPLLLSEMKEELLACVDCDRQFDSGKREDLLIAWKGQEKLAEDVILSVEKVTIPHIVSKEVIEPFMDDSYHGTTFLIFEPNEQLLELEKTNRNDETETDNVDEIQRSLSGIFNKFDSTLHQDFTTQFTLKTETGERDIIGSFYDASDLKKADHYIKGLFDEYGKFTGIVRVFEETYEIEYRPVRKPGKTPYGPFNFELGYMEGTPGSSMLSPEEYTRLEEITDKFGGLYIYRDQFRVLPYGRKDYDFLKFEERRTKKTGLHYFSQRNMFGYIGIGRNLNPQLKDKAGREGFVENKAYKEFKADLIGFFESLAFNYFRSVGKDEVDNARSRQIKLIQERNKKVIEEEKKKNKLTKTKFNADVKAYQSELANLKSSVESLQLELKDKANQVIVQYEEYSYVAKKLDDSRAQLRALRLSRPKRITLTPGQENKYQEYKAGYSLVEALVNDCQTSVNAIRSQFDVQNLKNDFAQRYALSLRGVSTMVNSYKRRFDSFAQTISEQFKQEQSHFVELLKTAIQETVVAPVTREDYQRAIDSLQIITEEIKDSIDIRISPLVNHVESLNFEIDDDVLIKWYKDEQKKLEEKLEATDALAQLGISVEIIDHELNALYGQMALSMNLLGQYASNHSEISNLYSQMHIAFEHMEANYKMLKPLYHNKRRMRSSFSGSKIMEDMRQFFTSKLHGLDVKFEASESFEKYTFYTFESIIESVFINVLNNALYWLIPVSDRQIRVEYLPETNEILIMNNGEKMPDSILEDIFTLFYTRKREGRGIGLYLCRKSLRAEGLDIVASNAKEYNKLGGACFIIKPYNN